MSADLPEVLRLLLVDGGESERRATAAALRQIDWPMELVEAPTLPAALADLGERGRFHCVVLAALPGADHATGFLNRLKQLKDPTPVVVLVGQGDAQLAVDLLRGGATDVVPGEGVRDPERLWQRIRAAVRIGKAEATAGLAREAQRHSEELLQLIVDSVPPLIAYIDASYHYRWNNRQYQEWFGQDFRTEGGQPMAEVLGDEAFQVIKPYLDRALTGETVTYERQLPYRAGARWVQATYVPHKGADGQVVGLVALVQDISERRAEQERRQRQSEFEQQLLGIVSHDLRNPISVISMNAGMLLRREDTPPAASKALGRIQASADRAARMVRDLLDFTQARLGGGIAVTPRAADLHEVTRQMVDEVQAASPEREIRFSCSGDGRGSWEPDRLGQIVSNLVTNALSYSPPETPVEVRTLPNTQPDWLVLEVHNLGDPIPPEVIPGLFQPFKRGRAHSPDAQRSIGLGLYIVRHLVDAHGGTIEVESRADYGTCFRVHLPRGPV
jgi:PAS domain S-box-containing protein